MILYMQVTTENTSAPVAWADGTGRSDLRALADRANQALADYQRLTSQGKLGEAGSKLDELKRALDEMNHFATPPK